MTSPDPPREAVAEVLAALLMGQRLAEERARWTVDLAPDELRREQQAHIADRERQNRELMEARVRELAPSGLEERFRPYFETFFEGTVPADWLEAQTFHFVGDALVSDFADHLAPTVDRVSAEVIDRALGDRTEQDAFALDEITRHLAEDPGAAERLAVYCRKVAGEALTNTRRALDETEALRRLLGGEEGEKRVLLDLLQRHRVRLDRMGIEAVDDPVE